MANAVVRVAIVGHEQQVFHHAVIAQGEYCIGIGFGGVADRGGADGCSVQEKLCGRGFVVDPSINDSVLNSAWQNSNNFIQ